MDKEHKRISVSDNLNAAMLGMYESVPGLNQVVALGRSYSGGEPYAKTLGEQEEYLNSQRDEFPLSYGVGELGGIPSTAGIIGAGRLVKSALKPKPKVWNPVFDTSDSYNNWYGKVDNRGTYGLNAKARELKRDSFSNMDEQLNAPYVPKPFTPIPDNTEVTGIVGANARPDSWDPMLRTLQEFRGMTGIKPYEKRFNVYDGQLGLHPVGRAVVWKNDPRSVNELGKFGYSLKGLHIDPEYQGRGGAGKIIDSLTQRYGDIASDTRGELSTAGRRMSQRYGEVQPDGSFIYRERPGTRIQKLLDEL